MRDLQQREVSPCVPRDAHGAHDLSRGEDEPVRGGGVQRGGGVVVGDAVRAGEEEAGGGDADCGAGFLLGEDEGCG